MEQERRGAPRQTASLEGRAPAGMDEATVDIAIIGYGPVGAAAANLCGRAGLSTVVVERNLEPYPLPRAIHFDAEAMRIFQSVGLADELAEMTRPMGGSCYLGVDGRPIRNFFSRDLRATLGWPASNLFYQPELESLLQKGVRRFPQVEVRRGWSLTTVEQDDDAATVTIAPTDGGDPRRLRARYVLACDGASSPTRKHLGIGLDDMGFEERWLVVDAFVSGPMRWPEALEIPDDVRDGRRSLMLCDPAGPATLIPGRGDHRRWEYMLPGPESDAEAQASDAIRARLADWIDPADVQIARAAVYRFHGLVAHDWRRGRVFLIGDAAHQTPPFFGQGMCHGLRDAAQLVWKLKLVFDGAADDALLDSHQAERDPHVRTILNASVAAGAAVCILDPAEAEARDARFRAEEAALAGKTVAMTDVVPPITAGVIDGAGGRGAGLRLPQPPVEIDGEPRRLDDLLDGRFALLSFEPEPSDRLKADIAGAWRCLRGQRLTLGRRATAGGVVDVSGHLERWMVEHGARWLLVRPDRYVFGGAADPEELGQLLQRLFTALHLNADPALAHPSQEAA